MSKYRTEIKWGLIFTLAGLLWMIFEKAMGWHDENIADHPTMTNLFSLVAIAIYVFALLDKRKNDLGGYMTFKQGFISGLIITGVVTLLTPLSQWLTHAMITPDYFTNAIEYSVSTEQVTRAEAEDYFTLGNYILQSTMFAPIVGIVTSAIVALILQKKSPQGVRS